MLNSKVLSCFSGVIMSIRSFFLFLWIGKTKAQRQKEHRERLKEKDNEKYLQDARERQKRNYISVKNMGRAEIEKRRIAIRERVRKSRAAAKKESDKQRE